MPRALALHAEFGLRVRERRRHRIVERRRVLVRPQERTHDVAKRRLVGLVLHGRGLLLEVHLDLLDAFRP